MSPPFTPDDYLAALHHCVDRGAKTIVIDSMSHEHDAVLEWHESEIDRLSRGDEAKRDKVKFSAWIEPKRSRQRLINGILRVPANVIFCFRAKEKLKVIPGKQPQPLGWMPIAGDEFLYELTACALLHPGANGVPTWNPSEQGEKTMVKRPAQFDDLFSRFEKHQLCEDIGAEMAQWAKGGEPVALHEQIASFIAAQMTHSGLDQARAWIDRDKAALGKTHGPALVEALKAKRATLSDAA
jgi:hypothetical protein